MRCTLGPLLLMASAITEHVAGAHSFRIRIRAENQTDRRVLLLDNFGIQGTAQ